jgi:cytochrome c oxidase subunit III
VLAVYYGQHGKRTQVIGLLGITCLCALGFMVVKYFEYSKKFHEGLFPDQRFNYARALYMHHEESKGGGAHAANPRASRAWDALQKAKSEGGELSEAGFTPAVSFTSNPQNGFDTRIATPANDTIQMAVLSPASAEYKYQAGHAKLFFSLYFVMTGLHGIHVLIGVGMMGLLMFLYYTKNAAVDDYMPLEMIGLYWHFVDLVWIFLFPMMYLIS